MTLRTLASKALSLGIKARTIWLTYLAGILTGCLLMVAWAYLLAFATPHAVALLQTMGGIQ